MDARATAESTECTAPFNLDPMNVAARKLSEDNRIRPEDRAGHDWYRFVLSFPQHLVRSYLDRFEMGPGQCVLDPFCGTGTTLVECQKLGIASVGIGRNPMAAFASRVKLAWRVDPDGLAADAARVAATARARLKIEMVCVPSSAWPIWVPLR